MYKREENGDEIAGAKGAARGPVHGDSDKTSCLDEAGHGPPWGCAILDPTWPHLIKAIDGTMAALVGKQASQLIGRTPEVFFANTQDRNAMRRASAWTSTGSMKSLTFRALGAEGDAPAQGRFVLGAFAQRGKGGCNCMSLLGCAYRGDCPGGSPPLPPRGEIATLDKGEEIVLLTDPRVDSLIRCRCSAGARGAQEGAEEEDECGIGDAKMLL